MCIFIRWFLTIKEENYGQNYEQGHEGYKQLEKHV